jgi:hypothetical protein
MSMPKTGRIDLDTKPVTGESDQGAANDAARQSDSHLPFPHSRFPHCLHAANRPRQEGFPILLPVQMKFHAHQASQLESN